MEEGYKVESYRGYEFDRISGLFKPYITKLYEMKRVNTGVKRQIAKFLLNALLGRFGMNIEKSITKLVDHKKHLEIMSTHKVVNTPIMVGKDKYLITYESSVSEEICREHGLNYMEVLNNKSRKDLENYNTFDDVSIPIAAFVTSRARVYMNKLKLELQKSGINVYYTDTDSFVTDKMLPPHLMGEELGQFKLEHTIKEGTFISGKTYCLVTSNGETIIKAKGVSDNSLSYDKFQTLYNETNVKSVKSNTKVNFGEGYTTISMKEVTLNYDAYKKRTKTYDENGR